MKNLTLFYDFLFSLLTYGVDVEWMRYSRCICMFQNVFFVWKWCNKLIFHFHFNLNKQNLWNYFNSKPKLRWLEQKSKICNSHTGLYTIIIWTSLVRTFCEAHLISLWLSRLMDHQLGVPMVRISPSITLSKKGSQSNHVYWPRVILELVNSKQDSSWIVNSWLFRYHNFGLYPHLLGIIGYASGLTVELVLISKSTSSRPYTHCCWYP